MSTSQGHWPITSSVDWCEDNYTHSHYVAEFWNTISSIAMIIFGEAGARMNSCNTFRFRLAFRLVSIVGIGSLLFHGTLTSQMQALDEVPMVWSSLTLLHSLIELAYGKKGLWLPILLTIQGLLCTASITIPTGGLQVAVFHFSFGSIELVSVIIMHQIYTKKKKSYPAIKYLFERGVLIYTAAITVWLIDLNLCDYVNGKEHSILPFNPQLHAIWHVLASLGLYLLVVLVLYAWLIEYGPKDQKCVIKWYFGIVPVCKTYNIGRITSNNNNNNKAINGEKLPLGKKSGIKYGKENGNRHKKMNSRNNLR